MKNYITHIVVGVVVACLALPGGLYARQAKVYRKATLPKPTLVLDVPYHRQEHPLSCEAAALRMLLLDRGIDEPEDAIIDKMSFGPMGSDPDFNFVGDIDGRQMSTGYGIHWDPVAHIADTYAPADSFHFRNLEFLLDRIHDGNPVIVWGSFTTSARDVSWVTPEGKYVHAVNGEHAMVVVGYAGPRTAPTHIYVLDPLKGEVIYQTGTFLSIWSKYNNSGVFFL